MLIEHDPLQKSREINSGKRASGNATETESTRIRGAGKLLEGIFFFS